MVGKIPASEIVRVLPAVLGQRRRNGEIAPTPTPAPVFTMQPTITGTVKVGQPLNTLTYNDGTPLNGTITTRAILLAGVAKAGTYVLVDADLGKAVTYRNVATGEGSPATATSAAVTVQAADVTPTPTPTPAPVFTTQPSLAPTYAIAGNSITITPGVVTGATSVTRSAMLGTTALTITNNTVTPMDAGTVTYQETATGPGGTMLSTQRTATVAAVTPTPGPTALFGPTGFNVGNTQLTYFGVGFPFLDRFKTSEWRAPNSAGDQVAINYNADRYPTAVPSGATKLQCLLNVEGALGPAGVAQRYVIETNKTDMVFTLGNAAGFTNISDNTDTQSGIRRYIFTVVSPNQDPLTKSYRIDMNVTSLPTPFVAGTHWVTMCRVDEETAFKAGGIFTQQFLNRFSITDVIRFMDWVPANHSYVTSWGQRPKLSWSSWTSDRGVPFEVMIALCNQAQKHMYVNIPVQIGVTGITSTSAGPAGDQKPLTVTDDISIAYTYIDNMAALIAGSLNSNLLCGIEFGNEDWNTQFDQYFYLRAIQPQLAPGQPDYENSWRQAGYRGTRLLGRFMKAVNYADRFMPLWCTQAVGPTITDFNKGGIDVALAEWSNSSHANYDAALGARYKVAGQLYTGGLGITAYFNGGLDDQSNPSTADKATVLGWANATDDSGILALIRQLDVGDQLAFGNTNSLSYFSTLFAPQISRAQAMQMPWFSYEGNFELPGANGWTYTAPADAAKVQDFFNRTFAHANFRALMLKEARTVRLAGGYLNDILAEFGSVGDTYATLNSAYGAITQRGLGLQDFRASPGPSITLAVNANDFGSQPLGSAPTTTIVTTGGIGRVKITVSGMAPGRSFDGFRTIAGTLTGSTGTTTLTITATDDTGATATKTIVQTVTAAVAIGKRYFRLTSYGPVNQPTANSFAANGGLPSLSEITFKNADGSTIPTTGVVASGDQFNSGEGIAMAIDGSISTFWTGQPNKTNVNVFDFGVGNGTKPATIVMQDRSDITDRAPGDFMWEWSDDGSTWIQIYRTIERGGTTPGNAVYNPSTFTGAYVGHVFTATMVYPA